MIKRRLRIVYVLWAPTRRQQYALLSDFRLCLSICTVHACNWRAISRRQLVSDENYWYRFAAKSSNVKLTRPHKIQTWWTSAGGSVVRTKSPSEYCHIFGIEKLEWCGYPMVKKQHGKNWKNNSKLYLGRLKMRERKTRHRQKCRGGKRGTIWHFQSKTRDWKSRHHVPWVENARLQNAVPVCTRGWKMRHRRLYGTPKMQ